MFAFCTPPFSGVLVTTSGFFRLVMRIMSFADYKLERQSPVTYDSDLISPLLDVARQEFIVIGGHRIGPEFSWQSLRHEATHTEKPLEYSSVSPFWLFSILCIYRFGSSFARA